MAWSRLVCDSMSICNNTVLLTESEREFQRVVDQLQCQEGAMSEYWNK